MTDLDFAVAIFILFVVFALSGPVFKDLKEKVSFYFFPPGPLE